MKKGVMLPLGEFLLKTDTLQWMVCKRKGGRWIPISFHLTLEKALNWVLGAQLKECEAKSVQEILDALSRENQKLIDAITEWSKNDDSE
jgi:hypothetical protein